MNLYHHYKNKPYRYRGIVKHSETLEDLVLYETLYENALGKLWVRPKAMFFEDVDVGGVLRPRFRKADIKISRVEGLNDRAVSDLSGLIKTVFGEWDPVWFASNVRNHTTLLLTTAEFEGRLIGFKLGWEEDQWSFRSWLGGVSPEYRGLGVAGELMRAQHEWCREKGYRKITTKTRNRFREMLVLNLKNGFEVTGTHASSDDGGLMIVLEKDLRGVADSRKPG